MFQDFVLHYFLNLHNPRDDPGGVCLSMPGAHLWGCTPSRCFPQHGYIHIRSLLRATWSATKYCLSLREVAHLPCQIALRSSLHGGLSEWPNMGIKDHPAPPSCAWSTSQEGWPLQKPLLKVTQHGRYAALAHPFLEGQTSKPQETQERSQCAKINF